MTATSDATPATSKRLRLTRRALLLGAAGVALGGLVAVQKTRDPERTVSGPIFLAACDDAGGNHHLAAWNDQGELQFNIPVPVRAHDICPVPGQAKALFFARRPGDRLYVIGLLRGQVEQTIFARQNRHFYGHGTFTASGRYLFTTENDFQKGRGVIGVYDAGDGFRFLQEFDSGDIGPHQLATLADGKTLVVANGGILTHPGRDREKLNLDSMRPSLAYIDSSSGTLLDRFVPPHHQLSIRHLAVTPQDQVVLGMQYQGDPHDLHSLVFRHRGEAQLQPMRASDEFWRSQRNYIASVAVDAHGETAAVTSPPGNRVSLWHIEHRELIAQHVVRDVSGITYSAGDRGYVASSGSGQVLRIPLATPTQSNRQFSWPDLRWDNHMTSTTLEPGLT